MESDGTHRIFLHSQRIAKARCQEVRQQTDRQVTGAAVETSDSCAVGDFSAVGPVSNNPIIAPWASLNTCISPSLMPNVAFAGVTALVNDLHRHPKSAVRGALPFRGYDVLVEKREKLFGACLPRLDTGCSLQR